MKYLKTKKYQHPSLAALLLFIFFFVISYNFVAQQSSSRIAELEKKLQSAGDSKTKIEILNSLGELYLRSEPAKARSYALSSLELSRKTNNAQGKKNSANTIDW